MDKLTALRVFRRVAELKSFSAAARDLDLSAAAISKNVRELEAALGARLINRTTRSLHLTEAGAAYLARASAILDDLGDADAAIGEFARAPRGVLKVSAPMSFGITQVAPIVAGFLAAHPGIRVDLDLNDAYVDMVDGGFDVGIRGGGPLRDSSLIARKLTDFSRVLCAAPAYLAQHAAPKAPADLNAHPCLIYALANASTRWSFRSGAKNVAVDVDGPLKINNSLGLAHAAAAGAGIALLPRFAAAPLLERGALVRLMPNWEAEPLPIQAIYPRHRQASLKVRLFIDALVEGLN